MAEKKTTKRKATKVVTPVEVAAETVTEQPDTTLEIEESTPVLGSDEPVPTAKAGKRSTKALKAAEEKLAKEQRKAETTDKTDTNESPKPKIVPTRSRLERSGKKFRQAAEHIDKTKTYTLAEAVELATTTSTTKFDATVEMHIRLNVDPKQADQNVRDTLVLPAGTGKTVRIAVFAETEDAAAAKKAGADISGIEDTTKLLDKNQFDFDVLIATPSQMSKLGKYARVLGPRGLMPNPKSGTVTTDVTKAVTEAKAGRVEYRVDSTGIVHLGIGKVSFGKDKLLQNAQAVAASIKSNKPSSVKATYLRSVFITTTMGPSISCMIE
jgi:large subunit ribosomal protein L1